MRGEGGGKEGRKGKGGGRKEIREREEGKGWWREGGKVGEGEGKEERNGGRGGGRRKKR